MSRPRLCIISSYNTQCGNASYTHVLKEEFSKHFDTDVVPVNFSLLANPHKKAIKASKLHLDEICKIISTYDHVNIQFESGLYGYTWASACRNIIRLINASKNLSFTVHRVLNPTETVPVWKILLKHHIRGLRKAWMQYHRNLDPLYFQKMIDAINAKHGNGRTSTILVHTKKEKEMLEFYYNANNVVDFPITFLSQPQIQHQLANKDSIREAFYAKHKLEKGYKYIGMFGFITENKAHHVMVNAMRYLPDDYRLLFFGTQHPSAVREYELVKMLTKPKQFEHNNNPYISSLVELVKEINGRGPFKVGPGGTELPPRVRFMGGLNDPDFIDAMSSVDFIGVPYYETGQGGSGNASLALELQTKVVFSHCITFKQLAMYYKDCFEFADIGNAIELAQRIKFWNKDFTANQVKAVSVYNIENNVLMQKICFEQGADAGTAAKKAMQQKL